MYLGQAMIPEERDMEYKLTACKCIIVCYAFYWTVNDGICVVPEEALLPLKETENNGRCSRLFANEMWIIREYLMSILGIPGDMKRIYKSPVK